MPDVLVRDSRIGGLGVFTVARLRAGELVRPLELGREITPEAPLRAELGERPEHCTRIEGRTLLVANPDRHFNHSCDPNVWLRFAADRVEVVARRDVAAGDELTLDYLINNAGGDSWRCHCGAARCRGETGRSFFSLPEEIQHEYLPLLAPWFRARHLRELQRLTSIVPLRPEHLAACAEILQALPEWFGLPESNARYLAGLSELPAFAALRADRVVGFTSLRIHYERSAEIEVMAVRPELHRSGAGRALVAQCEAWLRERGFAVLHVKTLAPSHPDPFYARTRAFYRSLGFEPVFETSSLWGPENPALVSVKLLG